MHAVTLFEKMEDPEVNAGGLAENVSNLTGRDAATAEGIAITYGSLFLMALVPILFGSLRSVGYHTKLKVGSRHVSELYIIICV